MTSASSSRPDSSRIAALGEADDPIGYDGRSAVADHLEQITVRDGAEALLPGAVAGLEVGVDRVSVGELVLGQRADQPANEARVAHAQVVDEALARDVHPARDPVGEHLGQDPPQAVGDRILGRERHHVARRALEHRHVPGVLGHRWDQGDGRRTAADNDHSPAPVVEVLGPLLRVNDRAGEALATLEVRRVARVIVVVAGGGEQQPAGQLDALAGGGVLHLHGPHRALGGPRRTEHLVAEADVAGEVVLLDGLVQVVEDLIGIGDRVVAGPGLELVCERVQVGVGTDARIAEQVPGASEGVAALEDRERLAREARLEVVGRPNPGDPRAHDQHVEMGRGPGRLQLRDGRAHESGSYVLGCKSLTRHLL